MDAPPIRYARAGEGANLAFVELGAATLKGFDEGVRAWSVERD